MRRVLLWLAGPFGLLCNALALVLLFFAVFDWNWLKAPLESGLSAATGKTVTIGGPIQGQVSWTPRITIMGLRVDAPDWKPKRTVATAEEVQVVLDLGQLLHGTIALPELDIAKPVLSLERRADGRANWDIAEEAHGPSSRSSMPIIGTLIVNHGKLAYRDPAKHVRIDATVATVKGNGGSGGTPVHLEGNGTYQNEPFTLRLAGDPLGLLRDTERPYAVDVSTQLGRMRLHGKGTITDPVKMTGLDVQLTVEGENAAELYRYLGIPAPQTPPYRLSGQLDRNGKAWLFKSFSGTVGQSDLQGSLRFDTGGPELGIFGNLVSKNLNLVDLGFVVGVANQPVAASGKPGEQKAASPDQQRIVEEYQKSGRVFSDTPLNVDEIHGVVTDVTFKGKHIEARDLPFENVDLRVRIQNGVLSLDPLAFGVAGGTMAGSITIDAHTPAVRTAYDLRLQDFQLRDFLARAGYEKYGSGIISGRVRLEGTGDSMRKSLGSSNGEVSFIIDRGTISELVADLLVLDVAHAAGVAISGDTQADLRCVVTDFAVKDGQMTPRAFVADTSESTVHGSGTIDLTNETLRLELKGSPKKASPLSLGGPIKVGGTFREPDVGLGAEAYARGGAAVVLGAVLTPLASILAFIDPGSDPKTDCAALESKANENAGKARPGAPGFAVGQVSGGAALSPRQGERIMPPAARLEAVRGAAGGAARPRAGAAETGAEAQAQGGAVR
jgi:uncharacterized protein involved in outer membrane biogenesis